MEFRKTFRDWSPKNYASQPVIPAVAGPACTLGNMGNL